MNKKETKENKGLRWFDGKRLVASLRSGDYAHAGEEIAIIQCFDYLTKFSQQKILDAGCGQGGTAKFIQDQGWGLVTGVDIEEQSIAFAKEKYPDVHFETSEIFPSSTFDLIILFNAFYAFPDQLSALKALRLVAHKDTELMIFEYTDLTAGHNPLYRDDDPKKTFQPIRLEKIEAILSETGWQKILFIPLNDEYEKWYTEFFEKIKIKKNKLIEEFGEVQYGKAFKRYSEILGAIRTKQLGGCILKAKAV